jgi:CAAX protease family protein
MRSLSSDWRRQVVALAIVLVTVGNVADIAIGGDVLALSWVAGLKAGATLLIVAVAARGLGMTPHEMGLARRNAARSTVIGAGLALLVVALSLTALRLGPFVSGRVTYAPLKHEAVPPLLFHALIALPLQTALPEELAFRGLLLGLLLRSLSPRRALVVMSAVFVAWHIVVQAQTLAQTNVATALLIVPAAIVAVAALFAGGIIFGLLRLRTGNLAGAIAAHWWFNAGLVLGLYVFAHT